MLNSKLSIEEQRKQDLLDGRLPKTSNKAARPRMGSDPPPETPYDPILNSSLRRADRTVLGSDQNATLAPMSAYERELASRGKVPPPYRVEGDPNWRYRTSDPLNIPQLRTGAPVMLPIQQQSGVARAVNSATKTLDSALDWAGLGSAPAKPAAPASGGRPLYGEAAAEAGAAGATVPRLPLDRPVMDRSVMDPFNLHRPGYGVMASTPPTRPAATPAPTATTLDTSATRLEGERRLLEKDHQDVMRRLRMLGPSYGSNPQAEMVRMDLIRQRQDIENRISTLSRAIGPGQSVSPADAEAGRARLLRTTGVDVRPAREKALAYAIALSNADPRGDGPNSPAGAEALETNRPFEEADFAKRQAARDARQAGAMRELTTPLPGGEAPLSQYERLRKQEALDRGRMDELRAAQHAAGIRQLEQVGKPDPMEAAQIRELAARAGVSEAQAKLIVAQSQQIFDEMRNPDSAQNRMRDAERKDAGRKAAATASATAPGDVLEDASMILTRVGPRFMQNQWLIGDTFTNADIGPNIVSGQSVNEDMADMDNLEKMVVDRLEQLAASGDPMSAARDAQSVLARFPRPANGQSYQAREGFRPLADRMTRVRKRLEAIAAGGSR